MSALMMTITARLTELMQYRNRCAYSFSRSLRWCFCTVFLCLVLSGCAATSTTVVDEEVVTNQKPMATYKSLVINDFELKRELFSDAPEDKLTEREHRYTTMPTVLAEHIERYVKSRHLYNSITRNSEPQATSLVLKGKFTRVGRFRISITATLQDGSNGHEVAYFRQTLWDVLDTTEAVNLLGRDVADFIDRIQYK